MTFQLALTPKQAGVNAIIAVFNAGAGTGSIVYKSATATTLATQVPPSFASADGSGNSLCSPIPNTTVTAVGTNTVTNFSLLDKNSANVGNGTVTANGGGGDITFDNVSWSQNGTVSMSALTYSLS
jgi:hypothetical protein